MSSATINNNCDWRRYIIKDYVKHTSSWYHLSNVLAPLPRGFSGHVKTICSFWTAWTWWWPCPTWALWPWSEYAWTLWPWSEYAWTLWPWSGYAWTLWTWAWFASSSFSWLTIPLSFNVFEDYSFWAFRGNLRGLSRTHDLSRTLPYNQWINFFMWFCLWEISAWLFKQIL